MKHITQSVREKKKKHLENDVDSNEEAGSSDEDDLDRTETLI